MSFGFGDFKSAFQGAEGVFTSYVSTLPLEDENWRVRKLSCFMAPLSQINRAFCDWEKPHGEAEKFGIFPSYPLFRSADLFFPSSWILYLYPQRVGNVGLLQNMWHLKANILFCVINVNIQLTYYFILSRLNEVPIQNASHPGTAVSFILDIDYMDRAFTLQGVRSPWWLFSSGC